MRNTLYLFFTFLSLTLTIRAEGEQRTARLGDFKLENGQVIRNLQIGYRTFGKLDQMRSNAVLFPTWFTGTSDQLRGNFGSGKLVDTTKFYVIAVDAIGNGVSTSPSNSKEQPRLQFPQFTIRDMVRSQYKLLTDHLGLSHLRAVMGISMGGMQTFEWAVLHPEFMDLAISIVGTPRMTATDLLLWTAEQRAIEESAVWNKGQYQGRPPIRALVDIHTFALTTPRHMNAQTDSAKFGEFLAATEKGGSTEFDPSDWLRQLQAMMRHDVAASANGSLASIAPKIKAKMLIVVATQDHMVNPEPATKMAEILGAQLITLTGDCGHLAPGCEAGKLNPLVAEFLSQKLR